MDDVIFAALKFVVIQTGRALVYLISFGRWRGEAVFGDESRIYGPAGALSFVRNGQRVITDIGLQFLGAAFYVVLIVVTAAFAVQ